MCETQGMIPPEVNSPPATNREIKQIRYFRNTVGGRHRTDITIPKELEKEGVTGPKLIQSPKGKH